MPVIWHFVRDDTLREWHPFTNVEYSLTWYLILLSYNLRPVLYVLVALLANNKHHKLLLVFLIYEFILFVDYVLIYSESPVYGLMPTVLALYMVWYHYKYE